jgi:two-component system chemotaxis sensor kinase CheA
MDRFKATFREEAFELLGKLEDQLLELEEQPLNGELINAAFRAIHTVKGSAAMFGFDSVSKFAHEFETALDLCRGGKLSITKDFIGLALKGRDHLRQLMEYEAEVPEGLAVEGASLLHRLEEFAGKAKPKEQREEEPRPDAALPESGNGAVSPRTYRIVFKPARSIFKNGTKVLNLVEELVSLGVADCFPRMASIASLDEMDPESCYVWWEILLTAAVDENAIRDIFIFIEDQSEIKIELIAEGGRAEPKRLGDILVDRGEVSREDVADALHSQKKLGEVLLEKKIVSAPQIESALVEQEHLKKLHEHSETAATSIRVASEKLDSLVDLVGELVTLQARLAQTSMEIGDGTLSSVSEQFDRLIAQLRDNAMSIRMLPIGSTFNKFRRVVRDLSLELGKEAELVTEGADTELDKTVIEKLGDPLVHIIRNSVDHGIELPEARAGAGKPKAGTIKLVARHSGAYVLITVTDDGKGLDREAIRTKAIERGLLAQGQDLPDSELYNLVFEPGFSTAKKVTTVSGRGVGMDVVRREIDSLGGSVQLTSEYGSGMSVTLKIPLTLAIIEGLLVAIGHEYYVIPLSAVDGCIEIKKEELGGMGERQIIDYREEIVPFVKLRSFFDFDGTDEGKEGEPAIEQIVIASAQDYRVGFVVDRVLGNFQTVIKPLGRMYKDADGLSGATILGDGTVALILDVNRLSIIAQRGSGSRTAVSAAGGA